MKMYRIVDTVGTEDQPLCRIVIPRAILVNGRRPWFINLAAAVTECIVDARARDVRIPIQWGQDDANAPPEKHMSVDLGRICGYVHDFVENPRNCRQYYACDFLPSYAEMVKYPMALSEFVLGVSDTKTGVCTVQKVVKFCLVQMPSMF